MCTGFSHKPQLFGSWLVKSNQELKALEKLLSQSGKTAPDGGTGEMVQKRHCDWLQVLTLNDTEAIKALWAAARSQGH